MLLTITTTHQPATDLGYLLHKNPDKRHEKKLAFGKAVMVYPEVSDERCTFALAVVVDPIALVRGKGRGGGLLDQYVNDRPYAASSFLSVAIARTLNTAFAGRSKYRQALAETAIPLEATVTPVPARGREILVTDLFAPLGYAIETVRPAETDEDPDWQGSPYLTLTLTATVKLADLLRHLYVLVPVLDAGKHYWVGEDEVEKLVAKGEGWLAGHPAKALIARRYLKKRGRLVREALARLAETETDEDELAPETKDAGEEALEKPIRLNDQRMAAAAEALVASGATRVVDLGCGEGRLIRELMANKQFKEIVGIDASIRSLERAEQRLHLDRLPARQQGRVKLLQGALTYRDARIDGFDAAALVEVIEHVDPDRLPALERTVFEHMAPDTVVVTTPNREYNQLFEGMPEGALRHGDHRFEWTRDEFRAWTTRVVEKFSYTVTISGIGETHEKHGAPTQMAVFTRTDP